MDDPALDICAGTGSSSEEGVRGDAKGSLMENLMGLQYEPLETKNTDIFQAWSFP